MDKSFAKKYVFLICSERSGSNLITRMMDSHGNCCGPSPVHLLRILYSNRHAYGNLEETANWKRLIFDCCELFSTKLGVWKTCVSSEHLFSEVSERSIAALIRFIYEQEAVYQGKNIIFIKENHTYRFVSYLMQHFPQTKFIHLVRDPRDMALSWKLASSLKGGVVRAAQVWQQDQKQTLALQASEVDQAPLISLTYENLLLNPKTELMRVCKYLGIPMDDSMLQYHQSKGSSAHAQGAEDWKNIQQPLMRKNFQKYKNKLTRDEIAYIEAICRKEMLAFGYTLDEIDPQIPIEELQVQLRVHEPSEKQQYLEISARERELREHRAHIVNRISHRQHA